VGSFKIMGNALISQSTILGNGRINFQIVGNKKIFQILDNSKFGHYR